MVSPAGTYCAINSFENHPPVSPLCALLHQDFLLASQHAASLLVLRLLLLHLSQCLPSPYCLPLIPSSYPLIASEPLFPLSISRVYFGVLKISTVPLPTHLVSKGRTALSTRQDETTRYVIAQPDLSHFPRFQLSSLSTHPDLDLTDLVQLMSTGRIRVYCVLHSFLLLYPYPHSPKGATGTGQVVQNQTVAHSLLSNATAIFTPPISTHLVFISPSPQLLPLPPSEGC